MSFNRVNFLVRLGGILTAACLLAASSCSSGDSLVIGSKNFTEQVILGEIVAAHIERKTELAVDRRLNLTGTFICDRALRSGELDAYVEYTGTAWTAILERQPINDREKVFEEVRRAYRERGLEWLSPLGFNNTFAIMIRGADARRMDLQKISDIRPHTPGWHPGFGYEFQERQDGLTGLVEIYQLQFASAPRFMELGLLYTALAEGRIDIVAGNSTDGLVDAMDLHMLEDDRGYFPPYDAALVIRQDTLARHPGLRETLEQLSGKISEKRMRQMNYAVDGRGEPARLVATRFLEQIEAAED